MKHTKLTCDECKQLHNARNVVMFRGRQLCWKCRPRVYELPTNKTLQMINFPKDRKVFK